MYDKTQMIIWNIFLFTIHKSIMIIMVMVILVRLLLQGSI